MGRCRDVVDHTGGPDLAHAAERHEAFAVLSRFFGVGLGKWVFGVLQPAEVFVHQGQGLAGIERPRHDQHGVVGPVVLLVEGLEVVDGHSLDVRLVADGALAVVVPLEGGSDHPLAEDAFRAVLACFEFVPHHGELAHQVFAFDEAVHHAVGFEFDTEFEVVVVGRECAVVIGTVERSGTVEIDGTVVADRLGHIGKLRAALEHHVFEKVGHAGFAVAFVSAADEDGVVHRHLRLAGVLQQQQPKAVLQFVFRDSLDRHHFGDARRQLHFHLFDRCRLRRRGLTYHSTTQGDQYRPDTQKSHPILHKDLPGRIPGVGNVQVRFIIRYTVGKGCSLK